MLMVEAPTAMAKGTAQHSHETLNVSREKDVCPIL